MIHWLINVGYMISAFACMEGVAWLTHRYIMHGLGWSLHQDHHAKEHDGVLERNDLFFLVFALPGIACLLTGANGGPEFCLWTGIGITLYGLCYFFVHDLFIHQRFKFWRNSDNRYLRALRRAHKMHHKHTGKTGGECFGMLVFPRKFFKEGSGKL
jgi:beta-carotene 3-hydroxylase